MLDGPDPSGCRFVAVASAAGTYGLFNLAAYTTAKHAVVGLAKGLAADLVATGVTAVAVSPGSTRTDMLQATADLYGVPDPAVFASNQLLRRLLEPDEVAATIAFCCSVEGGVLNGGVVHADGGFRP
jgi:NAD(P)-dependent dehydrogenase (short-subunit alcohol dehydrogenase family)